ncbi:acetyl-CoA sensor PanZ family protein [Halomonas sp. PAMB 3264]|uniref:GNAT family N-acetyltransferase n=1 Tax=Halomonas sp. PAMB 3264 TaxID=3075222 RepID=UPI00289A2659|nr:GNAT family N-acetyltransferase [Halomonas sp. PAMB 3264]WNL42881.1 acetyl-CoA sensor PanZ family protein [Halomonas sp. PAMB 3264]
MPVTLLYVDQTRWETDDAVRQELSRIYADAPRERLRTRTVAPFIDQHLVQSPRQFFACARFNGHLLGAVAIYEADDRAWWLSELCVKSSARRRGVGSRLMALLGEQAKEDGRTLRIDAGSLPLADRILLSKIGYRPFSAPPAAGSGALSDSGIHEYVELDPQGNG